MGTVKKGTVVNWRGDFGSAPKKEAVVSQIIKCDYEGAKDGTIVSEVEMSELTKGSGRFYIVDLDNGCWAWGNQIS